MSIQGMDRSGGKLLSSRPSLQRRSLIPLVRPLEGFWLERLHDNACVAEL